MSPLHLLVDMLPNNFIPTTIAIVTAVIVTLLLQRNTIRRALRERDVAERQFKAYTESHHQGKNKDGTASGTSEEDGVTRADQPITCFKDKVSTIL